MHYIYYGYGDVPSKSVSIFQYWYAINYGITNGINFHNYGMRNGTDFQDFGMKYKVEYTFSKNWYKERVCF